ncbi:hypothetical protein EJ08DRAFT_658404 [Tothia fuscella]|uniref:Uncharacterized protein n=1 Tax=Tothia fuscella TaxID=1048955 RepID=A0A9P4NVM4_9PEZI|nr:hypothetical protein EJ08DRAFT_658404 [Tothia fuscella]
MTRLLPSTLLTLIFTTLSHLPLQATTQATSYTLSSFDSTQRPPTLTPACNTIYTTPIPSCLPSDFSALNPCSAACISSLQQLQTQAQLSCAGQILPQQSMLRYFRDGQGVMELCTTLKGVATTLATSTSTTVPNATVGGGTSTATSSTTTTAGGGVAKQTNGTSAKETSGVLALSKPALLAVVISVFIAFVIFFFIAVMMYRKHYRK